MLQAYYIVGSVAGRSWVAFYFALKSISSSTWYSLLPVNESFGKFAERFPFDFLESCLGKANMLSNYKILQAVKIAFF
jgi:hypothetical protein